MAEIADDVRASGAFQQILILDECGDGFVELFPVRMRLVLFVGICRGVFGSELF